MIESILPDKLEEGIIFYLKRSDLGPLFVDRFKLNRNELCPFSEALNNYTAGSAAMSAEAEIMAKDSNFKQLAPILAAPDLMIRNRLGGSMISFDEIRACSGKQLSGAIVLAAVGNDGVYTVRTFSSCNEYVSWWVDGFAGKNDQVVANYIPPKVNLGSFLYLLHAVDCYRRESYQNALNYAAGEEVYVKPEQFSSSLQTSIQSKDMRWLLPAFVMLVPQLDRYSLNIEAGDEDALKNMQFFVPVGKPGSQEEALVFGEAGHAMGVEFMRTWLLAAGFELSASAANGVRFLNHFFIAPTALANHFVSFESAGNGRCLVNHQAYTSDQLAYTLEKIIGDAVNRYAGATDSTSVSPDSAAAQGEVGSKADEAQPSQWYLSQQGEQYGPYTFAQLAEYVGQGIVQPDDMVWNETLSDWVRADSVEGLFN